MKKIIIFLAFVAFVLVSYQNKGEELNDLALSNIESLAQGEAEAIAVCRITSNSICIIFSDGYFLIGDRAA